MLAPSAIRRRLTSKMQRFTVYSPGAGGPNSLNKTATKEQLREYFEVRPTVGIER